MFPRADSCDDDDNDDDLGLGSKPTPETDLEHLSTDPASAEVSDPSLRVVVVRVRF